MKIAAVIVTFNRIKLLKECLTAFTKQTRRPNELIIVDNASTDGTGEFLDVWANIHNLDDMKIIILHKDKNEGGSGGFFAGTQKALADDADWIWVSDDDAIPELDVFEKAEKHIDALKEGDTYSAVCTQVQTNGQVALSNRGNRNMGLFNVSISPIPIAEYNEDEFECNHFSYVGVFMNSTILKKVGLIRPGYFIWRDDVEHSWRLSEAGKIVCFTDMIVEHKLTTSDYQGISWKTYYGYRNDLLMFKEHGYYRYYVSKILVMIIKGVMSGNKAYFKLYMDAIYAAKKDEFGVNPYYYPGKQI